MFPLIIGEGVISLLILKETGANFTKWNQNDGLQKRSVRGGRDLGVVGRPLDFYDTLLDVTWSPVSRGYPRRTVFSVFFWP